MVSPGRLIIHKLKYLSSVAYKALFVGFETLRSILSSKPKMNILISVNKNWEQGIHKGFYGAIRRGFYGSGHKVTFAVLTEENIKNSDLVVPLNITDLKYLNRHRYLVADNPIPIPSLRAVNICDDKYLFYQTMQEKGFGKYLPKISNNLPYPYILKKSVSENSDDCFVITGQETESKYKALFGKPGYFRQQMVEGTTEYATHILYKNGKIISSINIKYLFDDSTPVKGKTKSILREVCKCPYLDIFADILTAIEFEGICCFNYKIMDRVPYVLEINPRFGGSLSRYFFSFVRRLDRPVAKQSGIIASVLV